MIPWYDDGGFRINEVADIIRTESETYSAVATVTSVSGLSTVFALPLLIPLA